MSLIIIDGANLAFRSYHTFSSFTNSSGYPTGMIYGFFSILNSYASQFGGNLIITWEGGKNWRKEIYPKYKAKRKELDENIKIGFKDVQNLCKIIGIIQISKTGFEADDVISFIVRRKGKDIRIISGDKDLIQLIDANKNIFLLRPTRDRGLIKYDEAEILKEFDIHQKDLINYLAIMGDKSDNIIGVKGFGKIKTAKLINTGGNPIKKIKEMFPNFKEQIDLNIKLINLSDPNTIIKNLSGTDIIWEKADIVSLIHTLNRYEIRNYNPKELIQNFYHPKTQENIIYNLLKQLEFRF